MFQSPLVLHSSCKGACSWPREDLVLKLRGGPETAQYCGSAFPLGSLSIGPHRAPAADGMHAASEAFCVLPRPPHTLVLLLLSDFLWHSDSPSEHALIAQRNPRILLRHCWLRHWSWSWTATCCQGLPGSAAAFPCCPLSDLLGKRACRGVCW